jgi:hypothetical protein
MRAARGDAADECGGSNSDGTVAATGKCRKV